MKCIIFKQQVFSEFYIMYTCTFESKLSSKFSCCANVGIKFSHNKWCQWADDTCI